jgi:hypothetical protein
MVNTATIVPEEQHFILSSLSPSRAQRRLALAVVLVLLVVLFITEGLLSTTQAARIDAFVPAYATAMFVIDLITAVLLFALRGLSETPKRYRPQPRTATNARSARRLKSRRPGKLPPRPGSPAFRLRARPRTRNSL